MAWSVAKLLGVDRNVGKFNCPPACTCRESIMDAFCACQMNPTSAPFVMNKTDMSYNESPINTGEFQELQAATTRAQPSRRHTTIRHIMGHEMSETGIQGHAPVGLDEWIVIKLAWMWPRCHYAFQTSSKERLRAQWTALGNGWASSSTTVPRTLVIATHNGNCSTW